MANALDKNRELTEFRDAKILDSHRPQEVAFSKTGTTIYLSNIEPHEDQILRSWCDHFKKVDAPYIVTISESGLKNMWKPRLAKNTCSQLTDKSKSNLIKMSDYRRFDA